MYKILRNIVLFAGFTPASTEKKMLGHFKKCRVGQTGFVWNNSRQQIHGTKLTKHILQISKWKTPAVQVKKINQILQLLTKTRLWNTLGSRRGGRDIGDLKTKTKTMATSETKPHLVPLYHKVAQVQTRYIFTLLCNDMMGTETALQNHLKTRRNTLIWFKKLQLLHFQPKIKEIYQGHNTASSSRNVCRGCQMGLPSWNLI